MCKQTACQLLNEFIWTLCIGHIPINDHNALSVRGPVLHIITAPKSLTQNGAVSYTQHTCSTASVDL